MAWDMRVRRRWEGFSRSTVSPCNVVGRWCSAMSTRTSSKYSESASSSRCSRLRPTWLRRLPGSMARPPAAASRRLPASRPIHRPTENQPSPAVTRRYGAGVVSRARVARIDSPRGFPSFGSLSMAAPGRIDLDEVDGVRIVKFRDRQVFDDRTVREVADQLFAATPSTGPIRMILDFSAVDLVSSALLGKLILLQRRVDATGGKLRLCEMSSVVRSVFKTSNLDRLFAIDRDRRESIEAF